MSEIRPVPVVRNAENDIGLSPRYISEEGRPRFIKRKQKGKGRRQVRGARNTGSVTLEMNSRYEIVKAFLETHRLADALLHSDFCV